MKKRFTMCSFILMSILLVLYIIFTVLNRNGISLYLFGAGSAEICFWLFCLSILFLILAVTSVLWGRTDDVIKRGSYILLALATTAFSSIVLIFFYPPSVAWHSYYSPDKEHRIVVNERALLHDGAGSVYEEICPGILVELGQYSIDDGYAPFSEGKVDFAWGEDSVTLHYAHGALASDGVKTMELNYVK